MNVTLSLPEGYRAKDCLRFLARDNQGVSERVSGAGFEKAFLFEGIAAVLRVRFAEGAAFCETDCEDPDHAWAIARRLLGLHSPSAEFEARFRDDPLLGPIIRAQHGLHIPLSATPWEGIAWAIAGQQITLSLAIALRRALILAYGTSHASGLYAHPDPGTIAVADTDRLRALKFSRAKADYLTGAAKAVVDGRLALEALQQSTAADAERTLGEIRGFGPWTVQYVMLRGLGLADCLPAGDAGLAQGLEKLPQVGRRLKEREIRDLLAPYAPYRSLATCHVWASL